MWISILEAQGTRQGLYLPGSMAALREEIFRVGLRPDEPDCWVSESARDGMGGQQRSSSLCGAPLCEKQP